MMVLKNLRRTLYSLAAIILILSVSNAESKNIQLHIPFITDAPKQMGYYHELLNTAIIEAGHTPKLIIQKLPQLRAKLWLKSGKISIFWMIESDQRNREFIPIETGITNGLIGNRILFIKKGSQHIFDNVNSLEDFRNLNLVGGMGQDWFDGKVWEMNLLPFKEHSGDWRSIYKMIPLGREYDYFPRGLNEILVEAKQYPFLEIEKGLVLIYNRDFRFYLSKGGLNSGTKYGEILNSIIKEAKDSGLIDRLVRKYWSHDFEELCYDKRIKIHLKTPD